MMHAAVATWVPNATESHQIHTFDNKLAIRWTRKERVEVKIHLNRGWCILLSPSRVWYCPQIRKCFIRLSSAWPPRRELSRLHCTGRIIPWEFSQIGAMINFKAWKYSGDALYFLVHHHRRFLVGPAFRPPRSPPPSPRSSHTDRRRGWSPLPLYCSLDSKDRGKNFFYLLTFYKVGRTGKHSKDREGSIATST